MKREFPDLSTCLSKMGHHPLRICLLAPYEGNINEEPAWMYIYNILKEDGHEVKVLHPVYKYDNYSVGIVHAEFLEEPEDRDYFPASHSLILALQVDRWLAYRKEFNLILSFDTAYAIFYALHAKKSGLRYLHTTFITVINRPAIWNRIHNAQPPESAYEAFTWHMERKSIEMSDAVISPGRSMLEWLGNMDYKLPEATFFHPYPVTGGEYEFKPGPACEIVFFNSLEYSAGLGLFCSAMDILKKSGNLPEKISFIGKTGYMGNGHALKYIGLRAKNWENSKVEIFFSNSTHESLKYLAEGGKVAVIPSLAANSSIHLQLVINAGVPFFATGIGDMKELVKNQPETNWLINDNPHMLAKKISGILGKELSNVAPTEMNKSGTIWLNGLLSIHESSNYKKAKDQKPFISICLAHYERPDFLREAVNSLLSQEYRNFEVILVDDGSESEKALECLHELEPVFKKMDWQILRLNHVFSGKSRNRAAEMARGEWLLFFDDDNIAKPDMLTKFAKAASFSSADLVVSSFTVFEGKLKPESETLSRFLPSGGMLSWAVARNIIGDTSSLVRKDKFFKYNGFSEDYGIGNQDYELYLRFALGNEDIAIIPDSLFWYRRNSNSASVNRLAEQGVGRMRAFRPFMEMLPARLSELALMSHHLLYENCESENYENYSSLPNSEKILQEVAIELSEAGQYEISDSINAFLAAGSSEIGEEFRSLFKTCLEQARNNDLFKLSENICKIESMIGKFSERKRVWYIRILYTRLLNILPDDERYKILRNKMLKGLEVYGRNDIGTALFLSKIYLSKTASYSIKWILSALDLADMEYRKNRPDVNEAIKGKIFISGLHHFALYGKNENIKWPAQNDFSNIISEIGPANKELINAIAQLYGINNAALVLKLIDAIK